MTRPGFHSLRVTSVEPLCEDAVAVTFDVPGDLAESYAFRPGQSLTLRRSLGGHEERRSYSICAPAGEALRIGVREVPGGLFSTWLVRDVRPGDTIEVLPPTGSFTPDLTPARHVLIAAGSGITPMLSIAASVLAADADVMLLYGNRRTGTVMFADELADLKDAHLSRFELVHVLSREPREAQVLSGRLDAPKLRALLPAAGDVDHWWLCGPYDLVTEARHVLDALGVPDERVHQELFYVEDAPPEPAHHIEPGMEGPASEVTLVLDGRTTTVALPRDTSILDGAQRVRPDLPFACKGGVCGTCRAKVVEGTVHMRRNFALEPAEVDAGFVLTCQSRPTSPQVRVDYDA
ncbi:MAG TPA: 1,2-phenylacetyl-CoA epoxidase subunit PaaE [Streptosporangiaceae bacterium]|nr:1,2-phenylacetyl-CoA epoxidase subunit PaaE [Streptosporangiaceae bacterium]